MNTNLYKRTYEPDMELKLVEEIIDRLNKCCNYQDMVINQADNLQGLQKESIRSRKRLLLDMYSLVTNMKQDLTTEKSENLSGYNETK